MSMNFITDMPYMLRVIAEDCNVPQMRNPRNYDESFRRRSRRIKAISTLATFSALVLAVVAVRM